MAGHESVPFRQARPSAPGRSARVRPALPRRPVALPVPPVSARRDRRGRGLRTPLLPDNLPASRTRAEQFDQAVLEAVADLELQWPGRLDALEFAVDEVPIVPADGPELPAPEVVLDGGVPLSRFMPPGIDGRGRQTKARVVVYRRPLEARSTDSGDLTDLVAEVLGEQLSAVLGDPGTDGVEP
jgi:hypothetical protein